MKPINLKQHQQRRRISLKPMDLKALKKILLNVNRISAGICITEDHEKPVYTLSICIERLTLC